MKFCAVLQKGFPVDATLDDIKEWLEDKGPVENIQMRRTLQKTFKVAFGNEQLRLGAGMPPGEHSVDYSDTERLLFNRDQYLRFLIVLNLLRSSQKSQTKSTKTQS